jgi:hypothetical protein
MDMAEEAAQPKVENPGPASPDLPKAWQPLTFFGVAAFSWSSLRRLLIWQLAFSQISSLVLLWFVIACWEPILEQAIDRFPSKGELAAKTFSWDPPDSKRLAMNRYISFSLELPRSDASSDLQINIFTQGWQLCSLLGCVSFEYPEMGKLQFSQLDLKAAWQAWRVPIYVALWAFSFIGLLLSWWFLSILYALPLRMAAFFMDRRVHLFGCWKLAGAALIPGALWFTFAIGIYSFRGLDLLGLLWALLIHFLLGWTFAIGAVVRLPGVSSGPPKQSNNPFAAA